MTTSLEPESTSSSRRALLAGAVGGLGALAASAIGRASPVRVTDGDFINVGDELSATSVTKLTNNSNNAIVLEGESGIGIGVQGSSVSSIGVVGISNAHVGVSGTSSSAVSAGIRGWSNGNGTGVQGSSGPVQLPAAKAKTGIYGYANQDSTSRGVWGESPKGRAIQGTSSSGYAGYFSGKVFTTKWYELTEQSTFPAAPAPNRARLFVKDNGSDKTQLCVRFNTGAVKVLATQP
jgi:hypothetical protein